MKKIKISDDNKVLELIRNDPFIINYLDIDYESTIIESLLKDNPDYIKYIEKPTISHLYFLALNGNSEIALKKAATDEEIEAILSVDPEAIQFIENPSEELQISIIDKNCNAYKYIKNPSEKVTKRLLELYSEGIKYIENPSEELKRYAVEQKAVAIKYIKNPSIELIKISISKNPFYIRFAPNDLDIDDYIQLIDKNSAPFVNRYDQEVMDYLMEEYPGNAMGVLLNYYKDTKDKLKVIKRSIDETGIDYYMSDPQYLDGSKLDFEDIDDFIKEDIRLLTTLEKLSKENQKLIYDKYGIIALTNLISPDIDVIIRAINDGFTELENLFTFSPSELLIQNHHRLSEEMIESIITNRNIYIDDIILEFLPDYKVVKKEMIRRNLKNK